LLAPQQAAFEVYGGSVEGTPFGRYRLIELLGCGTLPVHEGKFLPETVTVTFTDDTVRIFNPHDWVDIGPNND
jgi:hypothetical protein